MQTSERLLLTNLPNMWRQLVSTPSSGSFQRLLNAFSDDCVFNIYHNVIVKTGAIPNADGWCLVSQDSWLIGCGILDEGWEDQDTRSGDLAPYHPVTQLSPNP